MEQVKFIKGSWQYGTDEIHVGTFEGSDDFQIEIIKQDELNKEITHLRIATNRESLALLIEGMIEIYNHKDNLNVKTSKKRRKTS